MANGDTQNIRLGTCNVYYGDEGSEEFMGFTIGGVEAEVTTETQTSSVDQFGDTPVKSKIRGRTVMARMQLAETTVENMVKVMPGAQLLATGGKRAVVKTGVGIDLLALAKSLILRPVELDDRENQINADKSEDFRIPRASTPGGLNFAYSNDNERVLNTEFTGFPTADGTLFEYGDPAATE